MTRAQLKAMAKEQIRGKIGAFFVISLVVSLIPSVISTIPKIGSVLSTFIISPAFSIATLIIYLNVARFPEYRPSVKDVFEHLDKFWLALKITLLASLYTFLWSLLFIIPGIIKCFSYSQALYIAAENPDISAREAIRRSSEMMAGHKMEMFVLGLSFIGWIYLSAFTFGLLSIWLVPYINATMTNYYLYLSGAFASYAYEADQQV